MGDLIDNIQGFFGWVIFLAVALVIYLAWSYNQVQPLWQTVLEARSNVDASLKKRRALVNKLEEIAVDYAKHEKSTQIGVAQETRSAPGSGVAYVTHLAGQFPQLKTNETYQQLMRQLTELENDLQRKYEAYARVANIYNSRICQVPTNLYISKLGFKTAPFLDAENDDTFDSQKFTSNDGEQVRNLVNAGVSQMLSTGRQLTDTVVSKSRAISERSNALENPGMKPQDIEGEPGEEKLDGAAAN